MAASEGPSLRAETSNEGAEEGGKKRRRACGTPRPATIVMIRPGLGIRKIDETKQRNAFSCRLEQEAFIIWAVLQQTYECKQK